MDFSFNEDQRILADTIRKFFEKEAPKSLLRELSHDKRGYSLEMWKKMGELGWTGLLFDEEYGGYGGGFLDLGIICEEIGWAVAPTPFFSTVVLSGLLLQDCASTKIKEEYLPKIAKGEYISTLALVGKSGLYGKEGIGLEAEAVNGGYRLSGSAFFVPYAHVADTIVCAARTPSEHGQDVTLFIVDGKAGGLETTTLKTITGDGSECLVDLSGVEVSSDQIIGEVGEGWKYIERLWPKIGVALSCECVGGMKKVLEMTINHLNERIQFGKSLSTIQVVQHMLVDMATKTETSRHAAYYAAWLIGEGVECEKEAAIAKAWCGEGFKDVTKIAHQVTGGIGFTEEYDLQLYTKNAKTLELLYGGGTFQRDIVANNIGL